MIASIHLWSAKKLSFTQIYTNTQSPFPPFTRPNVVILFFIMLLCSMEPNNPKKIIIEREYKLRSSKWVSSVYTLPLTFPPVSAMHCLSPSFYLWNVFFMLSGVDNTRKPQSQKHNSPWRLRLLQTVEMKIHFIRQKSKNLFSCN